MVPLRNKLLKRNFIVLCVIVLWLTLIYIVTRDYTVVYIRINNKTALAIAPRDSQEHIRDIGNYHHKDFHVEEKEPKLTQRPVLNEINDVSIYIDHVLGKIKVPNKKEKEQQYLKKYKNERDKIIDMLPYQTTQNSKTTFHVLVDSTEKQLGHKYDLIVLVSSGLSNFDRRNNIRKIWGNNSLTVNKNWRVVFVLGGAQNKAHMRYAHREAIEMKDIMMEDFMESWADNMGKKVMTALQWVTANFNYEYILKSDDDVFVDIDSLLARAKLVNGKIESTNDLFMGNVMFGQPVERSGRYFISHQEHPAPVFKNYCSGGGYVLSKSMIEKMIPLFEWEHPLRIDDAYIGSLVAKAGRSPTHQAGFLMWNDKCEYHKELLVTHPAKNVKCLEFLQKKISEIKKVPT